MCLISLNLGRQTDGPEVGAWGRPIPQLVGAARDAVVAHENIVFGLRIVKRLFHSGAENGC